MASTSNYNCKTFEVWHKAVLVQVPSEMPISTSPAGRPSKNQANCGYPILMCTAL